MRKYVSGTSWCIYRWTEVDSGYITRLHLIKTPFGAIDIHWINHPDVEPYVHDHPVTFLSIILWGGYWELRNGKMKERRAWNFIRASIKDVHKIVHVYPNTITLCFMGPVTRRWGFHTPYGWINWKDYYIAQKKEKIHKMMKKYNALYDHITK